MVVSHVNVLTNGDLIFISVLCIINWKFYDFNPMLLNTGYISNTWCLDLFLSF